MLCLITIKHFQARHLPLPRLQLWLQATNSFAVVVSEFLLGLVTFPRKKLGKASDLGIDNNAFSSKYMANVFNLSIEKVSVYPRRWDIHPNLDLFSSTPNALLDAGCLAFCNSGPFRKLVFYFFIFYFCKRTWSIEASPVCMFSPTCSFKFPAEHL